MARIKFTRAGRSRPRDKGGQRWLHTKEYWYVDKGGKRRLRLPVYLEHGGEYGEDAVSPHDMDLLTRRHPECFTLIDEQKPAPAKPPKKTDDKEGES